MRKRIAALLLAIALGLTACGRSESENSAPADSPLADRDTGIAEDELPLTFPAALFEVIGISTDDCVAEEGENWKNVTVNPDGSVSAIISKEEREEFLNAFADAFEKDLSKDTAVNATDEKIPQRVGYTYKDDSFVMDIYTDAESADAFADAIEIFLVYGMLYQVYSGGEMLDVVVNVLDIRSGEIIFTESDANYLAYMERQKEAMERQKETAELAGMTPRPGMTAREVRDSAWGSPDKINRDTYSWGVKEQWVYDGRGYVYLEDGVVTSVSER